MKKISLKNLDFAKTEQLTRDQLKNVMGGFFNGSSTTDTVTITKTGKYKCCPEGGSNSEQCSGCVEANAGDQATCEYGVVTSC